VDSFPILAGMDESYVVISELNDVVKVLGLKTGSLEMSFNVENFFRRGAYQSQIKCGRIALTGISEGLDDDAMDVLVFDLKTGLKIFSCRNDLHLNVSENFVLGRDRLLLWTFGD
jgi:hypothetical protein